MKKLNNKGFTLVELLAVLVILVAIMTIAIPTISSSLERTKAKQDESKKKMIETACEQYVADHRNSVYNIIGNTSGCYFSIASGHLSDYLPGGELKDSNDNTFGGFAIFIKSTSTCEYKANNSGYSKSCK